MVVDRVTIVRRSPRTAPSPRRSAETPASAKSLLAPARERRGLRPRALSISSASPAPTPPAGRSCARPARARRRWRRGRLLRRGRLRGIGLRQDVSADAAQPGVEVSDVARARQFDRSIDRSQRYFHRRLLGFEFREPAVEQRREERSVPIDGCLAVTSESRQPVGGAEFGPSPKTGACEPRSRKAASRFFPRHPIRRWPLPTSPRRRRAPFRASP